MLRLLRTTLSLEVMGAAPEQCFNRWSRADLPFWRLRRKSELVYSCVVYRSNLDALRQEAERAQCELKPLEESGLPVLLRSLWRRPVLTLGLPLAVALSLAMQSFVWFVRIEGNAKISDETLLHGLWEEGLRFGAWGPGLSPESLNNRMLLRFPELAWLTVNRSGGVVTVSCAEREPREPLLESEGITDLVASRAGLIRELRVVNGFAQVAVGELVEPGDVLISGTMEWTTHVQATRAMGEVYASTLRDSRLICPDTAQQKQYTGREVVCKTLIFQRKRRKISGNSSIFGAMCDRMIETKALVLPGGYALPVLLEIETLREYTLRPLPLQEQEAAELLGGEARRLTEAELVAGRIETGSTVIQKKEDSYLCRAAMNCLELISRAVPAELFGEDEMHGEADQRGEN